MNNTLKVFMLLLGLFAGAAEAAVCTSLTTGNWNQAARWNCGHVPVAADTVVVAHNVTLNANYTIAGLTINNGVTLVDSNSNRVLTITGNVVVNGTVDTGGGRISLNVTGAASVLSGSGTFVDVRFYTSGAAVTLAAGSTFNFTGNSRFYTGRNEGGTTVAGSVLTINGTINSDVTTANTDFLRLYATSTVVGSSGVISAAVSSVTYNNGNATLTNNGNVNVNVITRNAASNSWTQGINSSLTLSAVSTVGTLNASASGNTVTYNGTATVMVPSAAGYWNVAGTIFPGSCPLAYTIQGTNPCLTAPTVTTNAATAVTTGGATLNGTARSNGASTTVTFDYGLTSPAYGNTITATPSPLAANAANTAVSAVVSGLACATSYQFRVKGVNSLGTTNGGNLSFTTAACLNPVVTSINRANFDPTASNQVVAWTVTFNTSVTGVDVTDFALAQSGGVTGASITSIAGSGTTYTVSANTGTGTAGSLGLNLIDNDSIVSGGFVLGGNGVSNGNFTGQFYTLLISTCTGSADILFCDDFERANPGVVGNGWTVIPNNPASCTGAAGNTGCSGIDTDIPPFNATTNRANSTRAMFTRWSIVTVQSPTINLAGKTAAQLSFWMRRGSDTFSECPEAVGENYLVNYRASDGTWKILSQYPSSPTAALCGAGIIYTPTIELPSDAFHANFAMQFFQPSGSGRTGAGGAPGVVGYDYWHMDDVVIRDKSSSPGEVGAFCDNFDAGLDLWSISAEGMPAGANIGDASVSTLNFLSSPQSLSTRWGYVSASTFKTNMVGVNGNITYWVKNGTTANFDPDNGENLVVEYLNSAGTWTNLATYLGTAAAGTVTSATHVIPNDAKHANFRLRFRQLAGSRYDMDYWHIDDVCVGDSIPTADLALVKTGETLVPGTNSTYTLRVTNNGPGTLSGTMQILDTLPTGLTYLSGNGTGWGCSAPFQDVTCEWSGTLNSGAVAPDLTLTVGVGGTVSGSITNTAKVTAGAVTDPVPGNNTSSYTSGNFVPAYVFTDKVCANGVAIGAGANPCNLVDWSSQIAGTPKTGIFITSVDASIVPTQLSAGAATSVGFEFGLTCHDPISNAGVQASFTAATPSTLPLCEGNGAEPTTWSATTNLSFPAGSPSVATSYTFTYADVGEVELFARNAAATTQKATSGKFVVKPAGFVLSAIKCTTADTANCGAGALAMPTSGDNPAAADAAGGSFIGAGQTFSVTVTAVDANGNATPNFGKEKADVVTGKVPESVLLDPANVNVDMVTPPGVLGDFGTFNNGVATGTAFTWGEVGIITLTPMIKDGDYLGAGDVTGTTSGNVGRFYPDHFDTVVTQNAGVPMACPAGLVCPATYNGIVYGGNAAAPYAGQNYSLTVTAKNSNNVTTANYNATTGFAKSTTLSVVGVLGADTAVSGAGALAVTAVTAFAGGVADVNAQQYIFSTPPVAPTSIFIRADDGETSSKRLVNPATTSVEGGVTVVSGRLKVSNAYGSQMLPLNLLASAQYFGTNGWVNSSTDSITHLTLPASYTVGSCSPTACTTAATLIPANGNLVNGNITIRLSSPGAAAAGSATVTPTAPAYLPVTSGTATFGLYRGTNEIIYQREAY